MKKLLWVLISICLLISITSCNSTIKDPNKVIDKILDLPQNFTLEKAEKDGFVVINSKLNVRNEEIDNFVSGFYTKDKQLVTIDENHVINFYQIKNSTITLFSYDQRNRAIIRQVDTFDKIELNEVEGKVELCLYYSKGVTLTSTGEKHVIYDYQVK